MAFHISQNPPASPIRPVHEKKQILNILDLQVNRIETFLETPNVSNVAVNQIIVESQRYLMSVATKLETPEEEKYRTIFRRFKTYLNVKFENSKKQQAPIDRLPTPTYFVTTYSPPIFSWREESEHFPQKLETYVCDAFVFA